MKNLKTVSILFLPYFLVCSGFYHLAFWDTFNINGLAYISVADIIKSSIYPFLTFSLVIFIGILYSEFAFGLDKIFPSGGGNDKIIFRIKINSQIATGIFLILWLIIVISLYKYGGTSRWILWGFAVAATPSVILDRAGLFQNIFDNNTIRQQVIRLLIYIPAFSFAAGKYQSELIQKNIKYKYTITQNIIPRTNSSKMDTLKFIGNTDQQIFMTDLHNSFILILRSDKVDTLILRQH